MTDTTLNITGMSCGGCVKSVTGVLSALPGVARVEVKLDAAEAQVQFDEQRVSRAQLIQSVIDAGFGAS